jgi:hypothetical protein
MVRTRLTSQAETKILLTKVDAVCSQTAELEKSTREAYKRMESLDSDKRDLLSRMSVMAPASELSAVQAESRELREAVLELKLALRTAQDENEQQAGTIQVFLDIIHHSSHYHFVLVGHERI